MFVNLNIVTETTTLSTHTHTLLRKVDGNRTVQCIPNHDTSEKSTVRRKKHFLSLSVEYLP